MHIVPPLTKGKVDLLLERLRSGTQDEQFVAVLKIKSLGVVQAVEALKILRSKDIPEMLANMIDEALMALNLCLSVALAPGHWGGGRPSQENPVKKRILR